MKYETNATKLDILKCLKNNLTRTGRSMVMVKATDFAKRYVVYILEGFIKPEDKEEIKESLDYCEIPLRDRCVASIRMIFGSPYEVEYNWELDFKKCQSAMVCVSDAMTIVEYMPREEPLAEDEFSKAVYKCEFEQVKDMELFLPYAKYTDEEKAAIAEKHKETQKSKRTARKATANKSGLTVVSPGKTPILQYRYQRKNKNGKKSARITNR